MAETLMKIFPVPSAILTLLWVGPTRFVYGNPAKITKSQWTSWGFNDSVVHTDIISTTRRTVTAYLSNGSSKVIYLNGVFLL